MELSMRELNELIYCIDVARKYGQLLGTSVADNLEVRLRDELDDRLEMELWDNTLLDGLEDDYLTTSKQDEQRYKNSHYVSNEEADEDFLSTLQQDEQRYEDSHMTTSFPMVDPFTSVMDDYRIHLRKLKTRGYASQAILDYVDLKGAVTHKELERYYKSITGSNSFSHILQNLVIPYKNRKTQRYLAKEGKPYSDAKYVVKVANPSNWVVVESEFIKWIKNNKK